MADAVGQWLVEEGIGETRALLLQNDKVVAAKLIWPDELRAGQVLSARLTHKAKNTKRGSATLADGTIVLIDSLPVNASEGSAIALQITRAPIAEIGRLKHAQARYVESEAPESGTASKPAIEGKRISQFPQGAWEEIWADACASEIPFKGGSLLISVTPAMTLIDIDGDLPPRELALAAVPAIAASLQRLDLGGNIGIDFPTLPQKSDRKAVDTALAETLANWRHERTAMNGFGFVQLIARLEGPSLLHRFATSPLEMCARYALRVAERTEGIGPVLLLKINPALQPNLRPEWLEELRRRTGRELRIETNPNLALEAPNAQIIAL